MTLLLRQAVPCCPADRLASLCHCVFAYSEPPPAVPWVEGGCSGSHFQHRTHRGLEADQPAQPSCGGRWVVGRGGPDMPRCFRVELIKLLEVTAVVTLKFAVILSVNVCFVSEGCWGHRGCARVDRDARLVVRCSAVS